MSVKKKKEYLTFNMCDFCTNEIATCQGSPILSQNIHLNDCKVGPKDAVVACDKYKNPVEALKKQFL